MCRLVASGGYSLVVVQGFPLCWLLLLWNRGSKMFKLQWLWLLRARAQAQQLWDTGSVAIWQVGSSWIRDQVCVSCIGRQTLYHWANKEALEFFFNWIKDGVLFREFFSSKWNTIKTSWLFSTKWCPSSYVFRPQGCSTWHSVWDEVLVLKTSFFKWSRTKIHKIPLYCLPASAALHFAFKDSFVNVIQQSHHEALCR